MSIFRGAIEKKLSALLGTAVTLDGFRLSPLAGTLEATGVKVAGVGPGGPVLVVRRVFAQISVAKAFSRQFAIKSLTIEVPVASIVRRAGGGDNLPRKAKAGAAAPADPANPKDDSAGSWTLEAQRVVVSDAQVHYRDESGGGTYHASAEGVHLELRQLNREINLVLLATSAGRRDAAAEFGPVHVRGKFTGVDSLPKLAEAALAATVELAGGRGLVAEVSTPRLDGRELNVAARGPVDLKQVAAALPPAALPAALKSAALRGSVTLTAKARLHPADGIHLKEFTVSGTDVNLPNAV